MKKNLFKTRLLSFAAFCGLTLAFASCANEDVAQSTTGTDNENDKNLTTFVAGDEAKTRTSMDYTSGDFYWEDGDKIWVKDDNNTWQQSSNAPTGKVASFKFKVPGKFTKGNTYKVYYPGKNGNRDRVTIRANQTQTAPNTTDHFGISGDCGTASALWSNAKNGFAFALDHQAAILVFQPYTSNTVLKDCYITKIEVSSDNDITNTYTLDPTTGELTGTGTGKKVELTTKGSGSYANGFPLTNASASVTTNGAYMVIKPGAHILKIRYWIKDYVTNVEGAITKTLSAFNYAKNTYYDMTANLDVKDYDGDHYYMWDAQKQYWYGWEWTKNLPGGQPTVKNGVSTNEAKNMSDPRWHNTAGGSGRYDATTPLFQTIPNVNEMMWYVRKGNPCWDGDELWTAMGHLYKGGIWFKKKAYISGFNSEKAPDGIDWRVIYRYYDDIPSDVITISASEANQYFYIPAMGYYGSHRLNGIGAGGLYWTSNGNTYSTAGAYRMYFGKVAIGVGGTARSDGARVQSFE